MHIGSHTQNKVWMQFVVPIFETARATFNVHGARKDDSLKSALDTYVQQRMGEVKLWGLKVSLQRGPSGAALINGNS